MAFSFIHVADIHLGRPFSDVSKFSVDASVHQNYKTSEEKAFFNFINFALLKNVDFVLIAGDTFDSTEQDLDAKLILKSGLKKLSDAGIKVYIICGNHDPLNSYNKNTFNYGPCDNIHIVGLNSKIYEDFIVEDKENNPIAVIHALSFENSEYRDNPIKMFKMPATEQKQLFHIGLLHCDLNGSSESPYAPVSIGDLTSMNYNYWALGHIHLPDYAEHNIQYSGTIQGRNTKETGLHGIKYIKVENNAIVKNSLVPVDVIRFEDIEADLTGVQDATLAYSQIYDSVEKIVNSNIADSCEKYLIRLNLFGTTNCYNELNDDFIGSVLDHLNFDFNQRVYISQIDNNTTAMISEEELCEDEGISGEIYKTVLEEKNINDVFIQVEGQLKKLLNSCEYTQEEYEKFTQKMISDAKQNCLDICNRLYNNEKKEDVNG